MPVLTRNTGPRGPRFFDEDGTVMFVHVLDGSTRFGPYAATDEDKLNHPAAWADYHKAADSFPGTPPVTFTDPPEGRPAPRQYRRRGAQ